MTSSLWAADSRKPFVNGRASPNCELCSARKFPDVVLRVDLGGPNGDSWQYELALGQDNRQRPQIQREIVRRGARELVMRPDPSDVEDPERLTQTYLQQVNVNKDFRPLVSEWRKDASEGSGKPARLTALTGLLNITDSAVLDTLRYQLLHRTASAVLEARRFHAAVAMMLVHAFGDNSHFDQFSAFAKLLAVDAASPGLFRVPAMSSPDLYLG